MVIIAPAMESALATGSCPVNNMDHYVVYFQLAAITFAVIAPLIFIFQIIIEGIIEYMKRMR